MTRKQTAERDAPPADGRIWQAVDRLIDRAPDVRALTANRLHLLAARRWREGGTPVPEELEAAERRNVVATLVAPEILARARRACDGPLVLHKGPEIGSWYPDPALRPFVDLDLLVPDVASVQRSLVAAGFVEVGDPDVYESSPHGLPLQWPGLPLLVEVHRDPNWPSWVPLRPTSEFLAEAVPSRLGVAGISTLARHHHTLVVAAHSWAHGPFSRVGDLVDVAVLSDGLDRGELAALARRWGLERIWRTTLETVDAVLFGAPTPLAVRLWARNLPSVRERTIFEIHVGRWLAGFSGAGPGRGLRVLGHELAKDLRPLKGEPWTVKLGRARLALRNARVTKSRHDEDLRRTGRL